ncbi:EF-hand domain-containing family member C2-like [Glandiceps talaboti]
MIVSMPGKGDGDVDTESEASKSIPPFLPGFPHPLNSPHLLRENFRKSQHFDYSDGVGQWVGRRKPGIGGEPILGQVPRSRRSQLRGTDRSLPSWVTYDKKILCFDAYFQEPVFLASERYRVRKCKIKLFLADDTIQVVEPETRNSGMPQGRFLSKHRIRKPPPNDHEFYTVDDLNIGEVVTFYDRQFNITGCDKFTKQFLEDMDKEVKTPETSPKDPYQNWRDNEMDYYAVKSKRPYQSVDNLKQFLEHDREVLRFNCYWDDRDSLYGDKRNMVLLYYLSDDSIEIREVLPPNSGRELLGRTFLHRSQVPKPKGDYLLPTVGGKNGQLVLNVLGSGRRQRVMVDNSYPGPNYQEHYKDSDLMIGRTVNVWGRKFYLYDCDPYTKEHYKSKYGLANLNPVQAGTPSKPYRKSSDVPPYNGYGTEEDSLNNCFPSPLILKRADKDLKKFISKNNVVLRFSARLETTNPNHVDRRFIISSYLEDDTVAVFEPPSRNSGFITGKFLERGKVIKPNQDRFGTKHLAYYTGTDFFVGAHVKFNYHDFYIMDADEYTLGYMEEHSDEFPVADITNIKEKIQNVASKNVEEVKKFFTKYDYKQSGKVPFELFRSLLIKVAGAELTDHEILTVARHYRLEERAETSLDAILSQAHDFMRKYNFDNFRKIETLCFHRDIDRKGWLHPEQIKSVCHSLKMPVPDEILADIWSKMENDDFGRINYYDFIKFINWRENPVQGRASSEDLNQVQQQQRASSSVNYKALMADLYGQ